MFCMIDVKMKTTGIDFKVIFLCYWITATSHEIFVKQNDPVTLTCKRLSQVIRWQGPPNLTTYAIGKDISETLEKKERLYLTMNEHQQLYNLTIRKFVSNEDEGQYKCLRYENDKDDSIFYTLTLKKDPTDIKIIGTNADNNVFGIIGRCCINLTCQISSGYPRETLSLETESKTLTNSTNGTVHLSAIPRKEDHLKKIICKATVKETGFKIETFVTLYIHMLPEVFINSDRVVTAIEKGKLQISCNYSTNNAIKMLTWTHVNGDNETEISTNTSVLAFDPVDRKHAGNYTCMVENMVGQRTESIEIIVYYGPDISLEYSNGPKKKVRCITKGNPNNYTFSRWEHTTEFGEHIRYLSDNGNGTMVFPNGNGYDAKWFHERGMYICSVSNGIGVDGETIVKAGMLINDTGKPYFATSNSKYQYGTLGSKAIVSLHFFSQPKVVNTSVLDRSLECITDLRSSITDANISEPVFGKNVLIKGFKMSIYIALTSEKDFQPYTIIIANQFGSSDFSVDLLQTEFSQLKNDNKAIFSIIPVSFLVLTVITIVWYFSCWKGKTLQFPVKDLSCFKRNSEGFEVGGPAVENEMYDIQNNNAAGAPNARRNDIPIYSSIERRENPTNTEVVSYNASQHGKPDPIKYQQKLTGAVGQSTESGLIVDEASEKKQFPELNYIDVCFDKPHEDYMYKYSIKEFDKGTPYADIDFSATTNVNRFSQAEDDYDDDDFVEVEEVKRMKRKTQIQTS